MNFGQWRLRFSGLAGVLLIVCVCGVPDAHAEVSVLAQLDRTSIQAGEGATLRVTVDGAGSSLSEPVMMLPDGIETLGTSRSQSISWVNGKSSSQTVFRIELGADRAGKGFASARP